MAYRRSLCTRANLIARQCHPSISIFGYTGDRKHQHVDEDSVSHEKISNFLQRRSFGTSFNVSGRSNFFARDRRYPNAFLSSTAGSFFCRYMSSSIDEGAENFEFMSDVAEVITDTTVQSAVSQAAAANEVAIAAADSFLPVKALMYFIDGLHSFTGLNWWASIVLSTLLISGATIPLLINTLKSASNIHLLLKSPQMKEIQELKKKGKNEGDLLERAEKGKKLLKEFDVNPYVPYQVLLILGLHISFFVAVSNMAEKMPSFKNGGALWFVDLTTPDTMQFPILTALTYLIILEIIAPNSSQKNHLAGIAENVLRGLVIASVLHLLASIFPKAIFCYIFTHYLFSLAFTAVLKIPGVLEALGVRKHEYKR